MRSQDALLAVFIAAVSALPSPKADFVTPISLSKKNVINRADGTVKIDVLRAQLAKASEKFHGGFQAFQANTGREHRLAKGAARAFAKRQNVALQPDEFLSFWFGDIEVGTPPVTFTVDFDTGSSDTFLPSTECDSSCDGHTLWDTSASSTAVNTTAPYSLAFGDGSTVSGIVFEDTMTVGGFSATGQAVGASTTYSTGFTVDGGFTADGLAGMAFPALSVFGENDFFTTLFDEGAVLANQFGFKLSENGSELFLGGVNNALFTGSFKTIPIVQDAFWEVALTGIGFNNRLLLSGSVPAIVDTGTTLLIGDTQDVRIVYSQIPGAKDASAVIGDGFFTVPCNNVPTVFVTMNGNSFPVSPEILNLGQLFEGGADCVGGLVGLDAGFWVLGDVFLRNFYTSFDRANDNVGFATLA